MRILYPLPKHLLAPQKPRIGMPLPDHEIGTIAAMRDPQLFQRIGVAVPLQMVDDPATCDAFDKAKNILRIYLTICNQVKMVEHYHIGEDQKLSGKTCFV